MNARADSFEEVEAQAERWSFATYQLEPGPYRATVQAVHSPRVQLGRTWRARRSFLEGRIPAGSVLLALPANRQTQLCFRGHLVGDHEAVLLHHTEAMEVAISGESDVVTLAVSEAEMARRAEILWHRTLPRPGDSGTFLRGLPHSALAHGSQLLATLIELLPRCGTLAGERPARAFENHLLEGLLARLERPGPIPHTVGRHRLARRAEEYLRAHCHEEISLTDLCAVTGATRRTLHLGFSEVYGMPPMVYLKALRLSRVRRDLVGAPPASGSVTEAAMRWGFNHLGRFSAEYRAFFGELPSVARARADRHASVTRRFC